MPIAEQIAAYKSWAKTSDRTARTANARNAFENRFLAKAGGDPKRAEALRKAFYLELAQKSANARKRRREIEESNRQARIAALLANDAPVDRRTVLEARIAELGGGDNAT
jgi:hypothetical protein